MTDSMIERATRALAKSQCGVDDLDGLDEEMQAKLREDVRAVIAAMREPSAAILQAMRDTVPVDGHEWDYLETERLSNGMVLDAPGDHWRAMIDAALTE
jgi:hypothetical protein